MRRKFRVGKHELDLTVEGATDRQAVEPTEPNPDGEVLFSRTWELGTIPETERGLADGSSGDDEEAPIDIVSADPFRLRNLLLVPSAVLVVLGAFLRYESDWFLILLALGVVGIGVWEILRRRERGRRF